MNGYWGEIGWSFPGFDGKVTIYPGSTENDWLRPMDSCSSAVDNTVETVNNILYMQIYQKELTNVTAKSIIVSDSKLAGVVYASCV